MRGFEQEPLNEVAFEEARECGRLGKASSDVHGCRCARLHELLRPSREEFSLLTEPSRVALRKLSPSVEHPARDAEMFGGECLVAI